MTKEQRAKKLKEIIAELLKPEPGNGSLYVEVRAVSAHCLLVEILLDKAPGRQAFVRLEIREPNIVRDFFERLTSE